jgi:L,D-peptidoglycan transpeptidase YkuD (ErfK/YbiS/YcfS/YnhG family)
MIIGQDESVFAHNPLGSKTWIGPKGQRPLPPKSEGDGYMPSAFVARQFGFGQEMTATALANVNNAR